ncbi:MAG: hypothetical protein WCJ42_05670 [Actinomycetes bacterium]
MGWLKSVLGSSEPAKPNLDQLFSLPSAVISLSATLGFVPTGTGSVAFRAPEGKAFADVEQEVLQLVGADTKVSTQSDEYGFTWVVVEDDSVDAAGLVTALHAVNSSLADGGFGSVLLCSLVAMRDPNGRKLGLVYLFKRGTFYPFAPLTGQTRDTILELQVRDALGSDLPVEPDLSRWFAVWGAPGL